MKRSTPTDWDNRWHAAAIGLGSNLGDSAALLAAAWKELGRHPDLVPVALSSPFRTRPVDMVSDRWFVNAAALIRTRLTPQGLLTLLLAIEQDHGRVRDPRATGRQDRTLDLDLLFYDALVLHSPTLILPHPRLAERLFVLAPLAEIVPDHVLPPTGTTIVQLYHRLEKTVTNQQVEKIRWPAAPAPG